jgi:hypothetical protein
VCLTEETVETLYLLGEDQRIVGVSSYAVRPPRVRREKPRISSFISADVSKILALEPDLALTFSDLHSGVQSSVIRSPSSNLRKSVFAPSCRRYRTGSKSPTSRRPVGPFGR